MGVERAERDLDLVALATVADMVPLTGENRSLVRRGLEQARRAARPGLRALMVAAHVAPERLDEADLSFRLAPRINAAGRLYRADAAVELFLTADEGRAGRIAEELDRANHERRQTEAEVLADAERRLRDLGPEGADAPAIVLWGEGWHPGVVGICASRMAERRLKPAVLIALDEDGQGKGSGRSVPGFDLLAGLRACEDTLARYGGHRAAAGLEIERERARRVPNGVLGARSHGARGASRNSQRGDRRGGRRRGPRARRRAPARRPWARSARTTRRSACWSPPPGSRTSGRWARRRSTLASASPAGPPAPRAWRSASAAPSHVRPTPVRPTCPSRLELNEWNGAVSPRIVLGSVYAPPLAVHGEWRAGDEEFEARFAAEFDHERDRRRTRRPRTRPRADRPDPGIGRRVGRRAGVERASRCWWSARTPSGGGRSSRTRRVPRGSGAARRRSLAARGSLAAGREVVARLLAGERGGVALADWPALALAPELAGRFTHVVLADPAPGPRVEAIALAAARDGGGYAHVLSSHREAGLAVRALELAYPGREGLGPCLSCAGRAGRRPHDLARLRAGLEATRRAARAGMVRAGDPRPGRDRGGSRDGDRPCTHVRGRILGAWRAWAVAQARRQFEGSRGVLAIPDEGQRTELETDAGGGVDGDGQNGDFVADESLMLTPEPGGHTRVGTHEHTAAVEVADDEYTKNSDRRRAGAPRRPVRRRHRARRRGDLGARPARRRAGVRVRLRPPCGPAPAFRRGLHHPPGRGREDLRRAAARHRDPLRGPAPRHGRGHVGQPR